jgi:hypothetical protein
MTQASTSAEISGSRAFDALIHATCDLVGVPLTDAWLDLGTSDYRCATFQIEGVACIVSHRSTHPSALFIHCVFGPVPGQRSTEALLALLQLNLAMQGERSPVFGADPERNLLLCVEKRLSDLGATQLAQSLEHLATQAVAWREVWL